MRFDDYDQQAAPPRAPSPPRRYLWLFRSKGMAGACIYLFFMVVGLVLSWLELFGILPTLILTATVFGLLHLGYSLYFLDDDDGDDRRREKKQVIFFWK